MPILDDIWIAFYLMQGDGKEKLIGKLEGLDHKPNVGEWVRLPGQDERLVKKVVREYDEKHKLSIKVVVC